MYWFIICGGFVVKELPTSCQDTRLTFKHMTPFHFLCQRGLRKQTHKCYQHTYTKIKARTYNTLSSLTTNKQLIEMLTCCAHNQFTNEISAICTFQSFGFDPEVFLSSSDSQDIVFSFLCDIHFVCRRKWMKLKYINIYCPFSEAVFKTTCPDSIKKQHEAQCDTFMLIYVFCWFL